MGSCMLEMRSFMFEMRSCGQHLHVSVIAENGDSSLVSTVTVVVNLHM
jgi:hypothetical protein